MAAQESVAFRNAGLNAKAASLGQSATLTIFAGAKPADCTQPDPVNPLVPMSLPASPFGPAANGVLSLTGLWRGIGTGAGTASSFRIYDSGINCAIQGVVPDDLTLSNVHINVGQAVTVLACNITAGNP